MVSEAARTRLLWAILSLVLPVTFGDTTACLSPAPTFSAAIYFTVKRSAPFPAVLRILPRPRRQLCTGHHRTFHPFSRRLAPFFLVPGCGCPLVGIDTERSEIVQETPHLLFFLAPNAAHASHQFSEHHTLRQCRVLHSRHKSREQDPPPAHNRLDTLTSRLHKRVQIRNRVVGAIVLSPTDTASSGSCGGLGAACRTGTCVGFT